MKYDNWYEDALIAASEAVRNLLLRRVDQEHPNGADYKLMELEKMASFRNKLERQVERVMRERWEQEDLDELRARVAATLPEPTPEPKPRSNAKTIRVNVRDKKVWIEDAK